MTPGRRSRRLPKDLHAVVTGILAELPPEPPARAESYWSRVVGRRPRKWSLYTAHATDTGVTVVKAARGDEEPEIVIKVATAAPVGAQLERHAAAITALRADPRPGPWLELVPSVLASGAVDGRFYVVEGAMAGVPATSLLVDDRRREELVHTSLSTITALHRLTASTTCVDQEVLHRWVTAPVDVLRQVVSVSRALERIHDELCEFLSGRTVPVSWVHGDYWPGNVLVDHASSALTGVVDWECSADGELPAHDAFHFVLFTRALLERSDLGPLVRDLLLGRSAMAPERDRLEGFVPEDDPGWFRSALLLYWLRHLASHLGQPATGTNQWVWALRNVTPVLRAG